MLKTLTHFKAINGLSYGSTIPSRIDDLLAFRDWRSLGILRKLDKLLPLEFYRIWLNRLGCQSAGEYFPIRNFVLILPFVLLVSGIARAGREPLLGIRLLGECLSLQQIDNF